MYDYQLTINFVAKNAEEAQKVQSKLTQSAARNSANKEATSQLHSAVGESNMYKSSVV